MTEELKLRECPFCGKPAIVAPDEVGSGGQHVLPYHAGCYLHRGGCGFVFSDDDKEVAVKLWNTRSPSPELTQLVKAARIALGQMTGGMDGYWPAGVSEVDLLREALVPFKEVE